jgi:hypothetical protein
MDLLAKLLPKKEPTRDEFAALVMKALAQTGIGNIVYESAHFVLKVNGENNTIFLDNGYAAYCKADKKQRQAVIAQFCSGWKQAPEIPTDFESIKPRLMPVIRDEMNSHLFELDLRSKNIDVSKAECPTKLLVGSLVVGIAYDTEHSIQHINKTSFDEWNVSFEDALKQAKDNLRDKTDPNGMKEEAPGLYRSQWADSHDCTRILMTDLIYRINVDGDPIAFLPNRNQLWVTGSRNNAGLGLLLKLGNEVHFEPYPISPDLFILREGVWEIYVPEDPAVRDLLHSLKRRREGVDYQQQKRALDAIHEAEGTDIFVASFLLVTRKDESQYSTCVWTKGVESLLPKTEYISLLIDQETKDHISLPWERALPVLESLIEKEPGILPERYRVRSFPNEEQLVRLRSVAE